MNTRMNTRWMMALLLLLAMFMSFSVSFAQDDGETSTDTTGSDVTAQTADDTDIAPEPPNAPTSEPAGVGEVAKAADNFNVPAVLTPQDEDMAVSALARRLFNSPADLMNPQIQMRFQSEKMNLSLLRTVNQNIERVKRLMDGGGSKPKRMPLGQTPSGDILAQVTDDTSGDVLTVFTDYSVVMADAKGETYFDGYIAGESAESLMIIGQDTDGNQYAISNGDVIGLTTTNDVFLGSGDHLYYYDYDEDGNFVSLTDSDGNDYDVAADEDGNVYITDTYGNTGEFYADGSYDVYDEEGTVFDEGALFGDNDNDLEMGFDEGDDAASFDENSDGESFESDEEAPESSLDGNTDDQSSSEDGATESSDANVDDSSGGDSSGG
jgi:hypothetical protein